MERDRRRVRGALSARNVSIDCRTAGRGPFWNRNWDRDLTRYTETGSVTFT